MNQELYQVVTLLLADGRRASFSGKAQLQEGEVIKKVEISAPMPLPDGCHFEEIMDEME